MYDRDKANMLIIALSGFSNTRKYIPPVTAAILIVAGKMVRVRNWGTKDNEYTGVTLADFEDTTVDAITRDLQEQYTPGDIRYLGESQFRF